MARKNRGHAGDQNSMGEISKPHKRIAIDKIDIVLASSVK
jgi:hypothetical protein